MIMMHLSLALCCSINVCNSSYALEVSGNDIFVPSPSHSQWFIPIPIPRFSRELFPFSVIPQCHCLIPFPTIATVSWLDLRHYYANTNGTGRSREHIRLGSSQGLLRFNACNMTKKRAVQCTPGT